jgi:hypothetical protein
MIEPGTAAWIMSRKGCLTGSRMAAAMNFIEDRSADKAPDGRTIKYVEALPKKPSDKFVYVIGEKPEKFKPSAERTNLLFDLLAERLTDIAVDHYVTPAMQWGLDHEAAAIAAYEAISGNLVSKAGYAPHGHIEYFGATPDGLVDHDGVLEVKCPTTPTHIGWRLAGVVPPEYKPQMIVECLVTRRRFADFVSYDPRMPEKGRLFVRRYEPTPVEFAEVESAAVKFLAELEEMFTQFVNAA